MALSKFGANYNPGTLNAWMKTHNGYASGDLIVWNCVQPLGLQAAMVGLDQNGLINAINAGKPVVVNVRNGGHWVLVTGNAGGGNFYVNDPGYSVTTYAFSGMSRFVIYTPVARVQTVRSGLGDASTETQDDSSEDEVGVQVYHDSDTNTLRFVEHAAGQDSITEYDVLDAPHQNTGATLPWRFRHPVTSGKQKPGKVNIGKMKPGAVQAGKQKPGKVSSGKMKPGAVQSGKQKPGPPRQVGVGKMKPGLVSAGKPKYGPTRH
jgi:hypothetical protein